MEQAASATEKGDEITGSSPVNQKMNPVTCELLTTNLNDFPGEEFKAALEETCLEDSKVPNNESPEHPVENREFLPEDSKMHEEAQVMEVINNGVQQRDDIKEKGIFIRGIKYFQMKSGNTLNIPLSVIILYCKIYIIQWQEKGLICERM